MTPIAGKFSRIPGIRFKKAEPEPNDVPKNDTAKQRGATRNEPLTDEVFERLDRIEAARAASADELLPSRKRKPRTDHGPTFETERKLRRDPIKALQNAGMIDQQQAANAAEVREISEKLMRPLSFRGTSMDRVDGRSVSFHPLDALSEKLYQAYMWRYRPWSLWASGVYTIDGRQTWLAVIADTLVDRRSTRRNDAENRWPKGTTRDILRTCLNEYGHAQNHDFR